MLLGQITFWNPTKGFGFINTVADSASLNEQNPPRVEKYFLHHTNFTAGVPVVGAYVKFRVGPAYNNAPVKKEQAVGARYATANEVAASRPKKETTNIAGIEVLRTTIGGE